MKKSKLVKYKIYLFLKQFKGDEIKLLMSYLEIIVHQYKTKSSKLFEFLFDNNNETGGDNDYDDDGENDVENECQKMSNQKQNCLMPKIIKVESLSNCNDDDSNKNKSRLKELLNDKVYGKRSSSSNSLKEASNYKRVSSIYVNRASKRQLTNEKSLSNSNSNNHSSSNDIQSSNNDCFIDAATPIAVANGHDLTNDDDDCCVINNNEGGDESVEGDLTQFGGNDDYYDEIDEEPEEEDDDDENEDDDEDDEDEEDDDDQVKYSPSYMQNTYDSNRRVRKFSEYIRNELEKQFQQRKYISGQDKKLLADKLNLTIRQVQKWFVHRREKYRRMERMKGNNSTGMLDDELDDSGGSNGQASGRAAANDNSQQSFDDDEDVDSVDNCYDFDQSSSMMMIKKEKMDDLNDLRQSMKGNGKKLLNESNLDVRKKKKLTPYVLNYLEKQFRKQPNLNKRELHRISVKINLTPKQIKSWFDYRRQMKSNSSNSSNNNNKEMSAGGDQSMMNGSMLDENMSATSIGLKRQNYPEAILQQLEKAFLRNKYISGNDKKVLADRLQLTPIQIERWFYYRRRKSSHSKY